MTGFECADFFAANGISPPSSLFEEMSDREAAARFRTANPRIFGSVLHGDDSDGSDLDLLVDALPGTNAV